MVNKVVIQEKKNNGVELLQVTGYLPDWAGSRTNTDTAETPNISSKVLLLRPVFLRRTPEALQHSQVSVNE